MNIYAIFANDKTTGITHQIFKQAVEAFEKNGHNVDQLNLYEHENEIPFFRHDRAHMENNAFYMTNQQRFMQADALLLVFPLFWYSVPAILKAWLDIINGWAYTYESGMYAKPKHKIKKIFIIYAAMQNKQHLQEILHSPVEQQLAETCKFIGIPHIDTYIVDNVTKMQPEDLSKHLMAIEKICKNY